MSEHRGGTWIPTVIVLGAFYALVGIAFAIPSSHVRFWRLAAWGVCAVAYAAHVAYERLALHHSSRTTAFHVALAAAFGAFGLAVGAIAHSLSRPSSSHQLHLLRLALVVWPVITGVPAFLVGWVAGGPLGMWSRNRR